MGSWDRSTPWRQGSLLTTEAAGAFALRSKADSARTAVMVISHDCDLAQSPEAEPAVELIVGRFIDESDGNFMHCKNLRLLHLRCSAGASVCNVELDARQRVSLPKSTSDELGLDTFSPESSYAMSGTEKSIGLLINRRAQKLGFSPMRHTQRLFIRSASAEATSNIPARLQHH